MIFSFLALLGAVTRAFGDFRDPVYALLTAVLLGFVWQRFPAVPGWSRGINWLLRWSTWALAMGIIAAVHPVLRLAILTAAVWGFDRYALPERRGQLRPLVLTGALFTIWWTVLFQIPLAYRLLSDFSFWQTRLVTQVMSVQLVLGPSASAIDLLVLGICSVVAATLIDKPRRWQQAILFLIVLAAGRVLYIWTAPTLSGWVSKAIPVSTTPHLDMPAFYFLLVAAIAFLAFKDAPVPYTPPIIYGRAHNRRPLIVAAALVVLAFIVAGAASYDHRPVRLLLLKRNILDDGVPAHGRYGDRSGGMFGFLPKFLRASGDYAVRDSITQAVLDSTDVIFIANLLEKIPQNEKELIWKFVERGGGLLIVGDHTGTDAIRDPTNDLLAPTGMELNFDTAVPLRRSWASAKSFLFHPLGRSGGVMDAELWLGASVKPGSGEPFVVGRGAFSDPGDMANKARSYLGNLEYDPGEPLGDVVLAAAAHWGKGKAVLHGDTSPYQNGTIIRSHSLINRTLQWMVEDGLLGILDRWRSFLLIVLLGVCGTALIVLSQTWRLWLATAVLIPALSVGFWSMIPGADDTEWSSPDYKQALIDEGHGPLYDLMAWEPKSIGGLQYNLMRNGFSPRFATSPLELSCVPASLYVIATPTLPYSDEEAERLESFIEDGGWVIVTAGWNTYPNVAGILNRFGLREENVPLGESDATAFGGPVKMADAYPVVGEGEGIETLIECFGHPVAKVARRGKGGLIAIGDSRFLLCKNLEGQNEMVVMENVRFFREIMESTTRLAAAP